MKADAESVELQREIRDQGRQQNLFHVVQALGFAALLAGYALSDIDKDTRNDNIQKNILLLDTKAGLDGKLVSLTQRIRLPSMIVSTRPVKIKPLDRVVKASDLKTKRDIALYVDQVGASHGLPDNHMSVMARIESNFRPKAVAGDGGRTGSRPCYVCANGLYQYIKDTAIIRGLIKKEGIYGFRKWVDRRFEPILSTVKAAEDADDFIKRLKKEGVDAWKTPSLLYGAHNQGIAGIIDIVRVRYGKTPKVLSLQKMYYHIYKNTSGIYKKVVKSQGRTCTRKERGKIVDSYCGSANVKVTKAYLSYFEMVYARELKYVVRTYYGGTPTVTTPTVTTPTATTTLTKGDCSDIEVFRRPGMPTCKALHGYK